MVLFKRFLRAPSHHTVHNSWTRRALHTWPWSIPSIHIFSHRDEYTSSFTIVFPLLTHWTEAVRCTGAKRLWNGLNRVVVLAGVARPRMRYISNKATALSNAQ